MYGWGFMLQTLSARRVVVGDLLYFLALCIETLTIVVDDKLAILKSLEGAKLGAVNFDGAY